MSAAARITLVLLTYNRRQEALRTIAANLRSAGCPLVVVDNGSQDGTAQAVRQAFPQVRLVCLERNLGAAGRNAGVRQVTTQYVAFADDDTCWEPGALAQAVRLLDAYPQAGILNARVLVGPQRRPDPANAPMAASPLPGPPGLGPELIGYMAGACVMRTGLFLEVGGYHPRLFIGGEEALLALDAMQRGWRIHYAPALATCHRPSPRRDSALRRRMLARNAVWTAWLRLPAAQAWQATRRQLACAGGLAARMRLASDVLRGLPWLVRHRRVLDPAVLDKLRRVAAGPRPRRRDSGRGG
ncbi:glycosyltransferase [Orrella sp. JC864]|uniref:glycosyltransferase family 2 protein n=1 Tax=Orrella sp. JC864 TaxID=3120298 RepID=UPI003008EAA3